MEVSVPDAVADEVVLLPPLFMDDPERFLILHAPSRATKGASSPFQVGADRVRAAPAARLANGREQRVCLLALDGDRQYDAGASFEILPSLLDMGGAVMPFRDFRLVAGGGRRGRLSPVRAGVHADRRRRPATTACACACATRLRPGGRVVPVGAGGVTSAR